MRSRAEDKMKHAAPACTDLQNDNKDVYRFVTDLAVTTVTVSG
jgi:hypothetical protein